jgi:hypothetical protein
MKDTALKIINQRGLSSKKFEHLQIEKINED